MPRHGDALAHQIAQRLGRTLPQRAIREDPAQARRADEVARLFRRRSAELAPAAYFLQQRGAAQYGGLLQRVATTKTLGELRAKLEEARDAAI